MQLVVATAVSGVLMWASFPPLDLGFLVFVAPAPFLWSLRRARSPREAGWLGFLFGVVFWGAMLSWIFVLGAVAWFPLTAAMGGYAALYALVMYLARNWSPWRWWVMAVGAWAAWEFTRARWPFGGFPWGSAGYPVGTLAWVERTYERTNLLFLRLFRPILIARTGQKPPETASRSDAAAPFFYQAAPACLSQECI